MEDSNDYYFEPEELNALFLSIRKAERERKKKNLTFPFMYDIMNENGKTKLSQEENK